MLYVAGFQGILIWGGNIWVSRTHTFVELKKSHGQSWVKQFVRRVILSLKDTCFWRGKFIYSTLIYAPIRSFRRILYLITTSLESIDIKVFEKDLFLIQIGWFLLQILMLMLLYSQASDFEDNSEDTRGYENSNWRLPIEYQQPELFLDDLPKDVHQQ